MIPLKNNPNVNLDDLIDYPDGRLIDNDGTGNGTGVNRQVYGDIHSTVSKLMRLYAIIPNEIPDNETNGFQIIEALRALASKNDFIYSLSTNGTILNVDIKFSKMLENEFVVCLAAFDKGSETQIKGIGAGDFTIAYSGDFKTNEYVRVIKTSSGVSIIRLADALSLDAMVGELFYLKKANQTQENAGAIDTVATTPISNLTAFVRRVIGVDSFNYLAMPTGAGGRNGLLSKEDKAKIDGIIIPKNIGWISGIDIGGTTGSLSVGGNISSASITSSSPDSFITVNIQNAMTGTNYLVRSFIESQGTIGFDNDIFREVFKPISSTQFQIAIKETNGVIQSLKIHLEVIQL